jgi:hypothetical protein
MFGALYYGTNLLTRNYYIPVLFHQSWRVLLCVFSAILLASPVLANGAGSFRDIKMGPDRDKAGEARGGLRVEAEEIAVLLRIKPLVEKLRATKASASAQASRPIEQARMLCLWKIFIALQEVRKVVAVINIEISRSNETFNSLTAQRNMMANVLNTATFMQYGILGTIDKSMNLKYGQPQASTEINTVMFGIGTAIPTTGLFLPSILKRKIDSPPNTLAYIFNSSFTPDDADKSYLWKFINSPIPGSPYKLTRREILIKHWEDFSHLNSQDVNRVKRLAATPAASEDLTENIRILAQRISLLQDLKTHIEEFDASLYELHNAIAID